MLDSRKEIIKILVKYFAEIYQSFIEYVPIMRGKKMEEHPWEAIVELIETCRHGVSLTVLLDEDSKWDKKGLQRKLRGLALRNKIIKLGRGKTIQYFAVNQEKLEHFPKIPFSKEEIKKHIILSGFSGDRRSYLNKYIVKGDPLSIRKCANAIFSQNYETFSGNLIGREKDNKQFSAMKRLSKQKTDMESHRILNPKINFIVLNI